MKWFYMGTVAETVQVMPGGKTTWIKIIEDRNIIPMQMSVGSEHIVTNTLLEPLCDELYEVGDRVKSILKTPFENLTGTVVALEYDTNRVIVRSDKLQNYKDDRVRYAYKVGEIELYDENYFTFQVGSRYCINESVKVTAMLDPHDELRVVLYDDEGIPHGHLSIRSFKPSLAVRHGIRNIQLMRR